MDLQELNSIITKHGAKQSGLLAMLLDIQDKENYLPEEMLVHVARELQVPLSNIYRLATFYKSLSLKPLGRHHICVCTGTACHVRGAQKIVDKFERELNIKAGETTADLNFGLQTVSCLGTCASGPIVVVDGEYHAEMSPLKVDKLLQQFTKNGEAQK